MTVTNRVVIMLIIARRLCSHSKAVMLNHASNSKAVMGAARVTMDHCELQVFLERVLISVLLSAKFTTQMLDYSQQYPSVNRLKLETRDDGPLRATAGLSRACINECRSCQRNSLHSCDTITRNAN